MIETTTFLNHLLESINFHKNKDSLNQQLSQFEALDKTFLAVNKSKYATSQECIEKIKAIRSPNILHYDSFTLLSLLDYFLKKYVSKEFAIYFKSVPNSKKNDMGWNGIKVRSKLNNLPHLIGISSIRDESGAVVSRARPRNFLDGVLYQWILLNHHEGFSLDKEKIEVFPWIHQTLDNPTYILTEDAINSSATKFHADLIFIRKIIKPQKYGYHIVGLRAEEENIYAFKSQFAITTERYTRVKKMFDLEKTVFNFYKERVPR